MTPASWKEFEADGWLAALEAQVEEEKCRPGYLRVWLRQKRAWLCQIPDNTEKEHGEPPACRRTPRRSLPAIPEDAGPSWDNVVRAYEECWE